MSKEIFLVIDDELSMLRLFKTMLLAIMPTATVTVLQKTEDVPVILETFKCDLIFSDLVMPKKSGVQVFEELPKNYQEKFILVTGSGEEGAKEGKNAGIKTILQKPFQAAELKAVLQEYGYLK